MMNSDAALNSVIIPETEEKASHFHISCYLKGRQHTAKVCHKTMAHGLTQLESTVVLGVELRIVC